VETSDKLKEIYCHKIKITGDILPLDIQNRNNGRSRRCIETLAPSNVKTQGTM
jgi:hypothetical protein